METYTFNQLEKLSINQLRSIASRHRLGGAGKKVDLVDKIFRKLGKNCIEKTQNNINSKEKIFELGSMSECPELPIQDINGDTLRATFSALYDKLYHLCNKNNTRSERLVFDSILEIHLSDYDDIDFSQLTHTSGTMNYINSIYGVGSAHAEPQHFGIATDEHEILNKHSKELKDAHSAIGLNAVEGVSASQQAKALESLRGIVRNTSAAENHSWGNELASHSVKQTAISSGVKKPAVSKVLSRTHCVMKPSVTSTESGTGKATPQSRFGKMNKLTIEVGTPNAVEVNAVGSSKEFVAVPFGYGSLSDAVNPLGWALCSTPKKGTDHDLSPVAEEALTIAGATRAHFNVNSVATTDNSSTFRTEKTKNSQCKSKTAQLITPSKSTARSRHLGGVYYATPMQHHPTSTPQPKQAAKEPHRAMPHTSVKLKTHTSSLNISMNASRLMQTPQLKHKAYTPAIARPLSKTVQMAQGKCKDNNQCNGAVSGIAEKDVAAKTQNSVEKSRTEKCEKENDRELKRSQAVANPFSEII